MTTLNDYITLTVAVGPPVEAGPFRLFPLFSTAACAPAYLCGPEAEASDLLRVAEHDGGGSVPELIVTSTAALPLLLLEGETVLGAKQNRTLNVSVLCRPETPTILPVSCVEAGRWSTAQPVYRSSRHAPSGLRAAKTRSVVASVRTQSAKHSDQRLVWDTVNTYSERLMGAPSPTAALEDVASTAATHIATIVDGLVPAEGQRGVIVAAGNGTICLDLFDKPSTLAAYWDGLLAGYTLDALGAQPPPFGREDAEALITAILAATATESPAVGLGTELHLGDDDLIGGALTWEGTVVHLAAFSCC
ncbi:MAG: hypothetical protein M3083_00795 [Actinomycetota bacterium]|nr:hypothetical protein [Actinomycetota bacterium]MDQ6944782.1 hypothetical protein [Actinomycetota bacterium]